MPTPKATLTYRQGNQNQLSFILSHAGELLLPSGSLSIIAEVRASEVGRVIASIPLTIADEDEGSIGGLLPYLAPDLYYLGLFFNYTDEPDWRIGVAQLLIVPTGSLRSLTDATGLNIQISENKQVIQIDVDATPSASIAAFYAAQVREDIGAIEVLKTDINTLASSVQEAAADAATSEMNATDSATAANASKVAAAASETSAAESATSAANSVIAANTSATNAANSATTAQQAATSATNAVGNIMTYMGTTTHGVLLGFGGNIQFTQNDNRYKTATITFL